MYQFEWTVGGLADSNLIERMAALYSNHYGVWGKGSARPEGTPIRLSADRIRKWLDSPDSRIAWATLNGELVGYAIAVQTRLPRHGMVSWVTQFVVHEAHRKQNVGKRLLFTIWNFTDHFAWGLVSANPYAIRALEKATRRTCSPVRIHKSRDILMKLGSKVVPYINSSTERAINTHESRINTEFHLDHSQLPEMLGNVITPEKPWNLGDLLEGWEWFAFTFQDQEQIGLTQHELEEMLLASDEVTKRAYSRMMVTSSEQLWTRRTPEEVELIIQQCSLQVGDSVVDFGCGRGRHSLELAARGMVAVGVDYVTAFVQSARTEATNRSLDNVAFVEDDCRTVQLGREFNAGICVYDVIGSYADDNQNLRTLTNLVHHVKAGGFILLSVMNYELTERQALHWFSIASEPDKLLRLKPSPTMEKSGNVFKPEHYMIDKDTHIVYRKEQFQQGSSLPEELLVRDKRYTREGIEAMCKEAELEVVWSRFVRAGWSEELSHDSDKAKEILVLCRKPV
jgi:2-polyprenyl-3-methyl-5-hydroxy-6-metoxy-1,4-benzoquinol methylase